MKFFWCVAIVALSCSNPIRKLEKETILKRMAALKTFSGVYSETGIAGKALDTRIAVRTAPLTILAKSVSPGPSEGSVMSYADGQLAMYFPKSAFGIRYRHVPELSGNEQVRWLELEYDWHIAHYDIRQLEDSHIAGFDAKGILYTPNAAFAASPFSHEWRAAVEPEYAFALQNTMLRDGKEKYRITFKEVEFQKSLTDNDLAFKFPAGTTIAEYDLNSKNYSLKAANATANFRLTPPKDAADFPLKKIIRVQGIIPAFTLYYENLPYQTYYTQVKDYGLNLIPERGLVIEARRKYRVNFAGAFRSLYFLEKGVYHTVVSSRPLSEVLEWLER
ncbi:MAG: hypothetical protein U1F27_13110 [Turneriella sp.]